MPFLAPSGIHSSVRDLEGYIYLDVSKEPKFRRSRAAEGSCTATSWIPIAARDAAEFLGDGRRSLYMLKYRREKGGDSRRLVFSRVVTESGVGRYNSPAIVIGRP